MGTIGPWSHSEASQQAGTAHVAEPENLDLRKRSVQNENYASEEFLARGSKGGVVEYTLSNGV